MGFFDDPTTMGLLGLAQGFGEAAMPRPYRVPFGAVLGQAAGGMASGMQAAQRAQLMQAQSDYAKAHAAQAQLQAKQLQMMAPLMQQAVDQEMRDGGGGPMFGGMPGGMAPASLPAAQTQGSAAPAGTLPERIMGAESGGNPNARNPNSSATGPGQFIDSTWLNLVRKYKPEFAGVPDQQILAMRSDPMLSHQMVKLYADENGKALGDQKLPVNDGTQYLAHWFGPGGAAAILKAPPGTAMAAVMPQNVLAANPIVANMTTDGVAALAAKKVGAQPASYQVASNTNQANDASGSAPQPVPAQPNATVAQAGQYSPQQLFEYYNRRAQSAAMLPAPLNGRAKYWENMATMALQSNRFRPATQGGLQGQIDIVDNKFYPHPADLQANSVTQQTLPGGQTANVNRITGQATPFAGDVQGVPFQAASTAAKAWAGVDPANAQAGFMPDGKGGLQFIPGSKADPNYMAGVDTTKAAAMMPLTAATAGAVERAKADSDVVNIGSREFPVWVTKASLLTRGNPTAAPAGIGGSTLLPGGNNPATSPLGAQGAAGPQQSKFPSLAPKILETQVGKDADEAHQVGTILRNQDQPAMITINNMRGDVPRLAGMTGALGEVRQKIREYMASFAPQALNDYLKIDASTPQEFTKQAVLLMGKAESESNPRGGFNIAQMYFNAFPGMHTQEQALGNMMNILAVTKQHSIDYGNGLIAHQTQNWQRATTGQEADYQPNSRFAKDFAENNPPSIYVAAAAAMNGRPWDEWGKGLSKEQRLAALDVIRRIDPTVSIDTPSGKAPVVPQQ